MKKDRLAASYLEKARVRFAALDFYKKNGAYSDVVPTEEYDEEAEVAISEAELVLRTVEAAFESP